MKLKGIQNKYDDYLLKIISQSYKLLYTKITGDYDENKNDPMRKYENIMNSLFIKEDVEKLLNSM